MLLVIIFALVFGLSFAFLFRTLMNNWISTNYNSSESKSSRYEEYMLDLQTYVSENELSSSDIAKINKWVHSNRNVYLFLYNDKQLLFDSSLDRDEGTDDENPSQDNGSTGNGAGNNNSAQGSENGDGSNGNTNSDSQEDRPTDNTNRPGGGFTVDYPTKEEILEAAEKNGLRQLKFSDGPLLVALADFTDYIYYDVSNIASIVGGVLIIVIILMLYFQKIIFKISRLAKDVSRVYEDDMNNPIRCGEGNDEISTLSRNVEQMRSSMIESLEKEKAAINANTDLITSMSHDIRTPLTVLLGYLDIMKNSTSDEEMKEYIKASESTAMRLKTLSDDMFGYFLVFGNRDADICITDYDARTLLEQLFSEHILLLTEQGYNIKTSLSAGIKEGTKVLTDAPKIMRVIDNLFSNIYKYADKEKEITIEASVSFGQLSCTVKNHILENNEGKESNRIGLKTCEKICESLGMGFEYHTVGIKSQRTFVVRIEFPVKHGGAEVNENA